MKAPTRGDEKNETVAEKETDSSDSTLQLLNNNLLCRTGRMFDFVKIRKYI